MTISTYFRPANSSSSISSSPLTVTSKPCDFAAAAASFATPSALPVCVPYRIRSDGPGSIWSATAGGGALTFIASRECSPARKPEIHAR